MAKQTSFGEEKVMKLEFKLGELTQFVSAGMSAPQIAEKLDVSPCCVYYTVKTLRPNLLPTLRHTGASRHGRRGEYIRDQSQIVSLYQSGLSMGKIAKQMGISPGAVYNALVRNGVARRRIGEKV